MLHEQFAGPEQVNKTLALADTGHAAFVAGEVSAFEVEDMKKSVPEGVSLPFFVALFGPFEGKMGGFWGKTFLESHGEGGLVLCERECWMLVVEGMPMLQTRVRR